MRGPVLQQAEVGRGQDWLVVVAIEGGLELGDTLRMGRGLIWWCQAGG